MTTLIAIPWKNRPDLLPKAVESALAQTERDIVVCVYCDGDAPPPLPSDPRLRVHRSTVNRGPYFGLQAMLLASQHELFAPLGADDYIDPDHLERMLPLAKAKTAVVTGRVWWHAPGREVTSVSVHYEVGLFRRDRLLSFGAYNPAERVGQDSLLVELIYITGPWVLATVPTYHRVRRSDSLSTSVATGNRSRYRLGVRQRNRVALRRCNALRGNLPALRAYRDTLVSPAVRAALDAEVALLAPLLR